MDYSTHTTTATYALSNPTESRSIAGTIKDSSAASEKIKDKSKMKTINLDNVVFCEKHFAYTGKLVRMYLSLEYADGHCEEKSYTSETKMLKDYKKINKELDKRINVTA